MQKVRKFLATTLCLGILATSPMCSASPLQSIQDKIGMDKIAHFGAGYIIDNELKRYTKMTDFERVMTVAAVATIKEATDSKFDKNDIFATVLGALGCNLSGKF